MGRPSTKRQEILLFLRSFAAENGYAPSVREIMQAVGLRSTSTVQYHLNELSRAGLIETDGGKSRAIRLPDRRGVPVVGTVAAGMPILAEENLERTFPLPMDFARKGDVFMLHVRGESMINAGILDGDYVIVEKCETARNGEMVVALVDDSATVKTFYKENGHFRLQPENDYMEPIIVDSVAILGKVVGVYRLY